jgi:DNA topoisomerase-1
MKVIGPVPVGRKCPKCGNDLIYRHNHLNGKKFIGCSTFPKCDYIEPMPEDKPKILAEKCPKCGANLVERKNHRGQ